MASVEAPTRGTQSTDTEVRLAAFQWLEAQVSIHGQVLPRTLLEQGFEYRARRVPLLGPQGIWKPQVLPRYPLSVTTTPRGPYRDTIGSDDLLHYAYRGTDPDHRDNVALRGALTHQVARVRGGRRPARPAVYRGGGGCASLCPAVRRGGPGGGG